jgi:intracellular septation protein A
MKEALGHILDDFVSAVLFLVAFGTSGSLRAAIGIAILAAATPAAWCALRGRRVEPRQWSSLGLSLALGTAAWFAGSPRFIMAKPSGVHFALAAAMRRGDWMLPYLNTTARQNVPKPVVVAAGYAWAVLMAALGLTNLIIALYFDLKVWAWFVTAISVGAKIAALALQYAVFRTLVRRRLARAAGLHPTGAK